MGARGKLNRAHFNGVILIAGALGLISGSGVVFVLAAATLAAGAMMGGEIRLSGRKRDF